MSKEISVLLDEIAEAQRMLSDGDETLNHDNCTKLHMSIAQLLGAHKTLEAENERLREAIQEAFSVTENTEELNMCNYNHDLVAQLNSGMIEVHAILSEALRGEEGAQP